MYDLFTIGHSTHPWEQFVELLARHRIEAIGDVRSSPYSARFPQYNRRILDSALLALNIRYVFLGDELGARRAERDCYVEGVAHYDRIARLGAFQTGLKRVRISVAQCRLALMCSEKDPLDCHRTILVCRQFRNEMNIRHILVNGSLENQTDAEARLMTGEKIPGDDLFSQREELIAKAYDRRGNKIAYRKSAA